MARILYGVMGNTYGHVARSLAIAQRMPQHEFHFVGGRRVPEVIGPAYPVLDVPVKRAIHKNQRISVTGSYAHLFRCLAAFRDVRRRILELIERWQPDLAICDREFFLPHAARAAGLRCVSLDHSQILNCCRYPVPTRLWPLWAVDRVEDRLMFGWTKRHLITSFYHPPLRPGSNAELLPPVLRTEVTGIRPSSGDHVLVYQGTPTFHPLIEALRAQPRPVIVYGYRNEHATSGNLTFKPFHPRALLEDLASCAYVVTTAGHNLLCEAIYFGKPVLCFPVSLVFEQYLNAHYVRELGYGDFATTRKPGTDLFAAFERRLDERRSSTARESMNGTDRVVARVQQLIDARN